MARKSTEKAAENSLNEILADKTIRRKQKVLSISELLGNNKITIQHLITVAATKKDTEKAALIESIEYVTKKKPEVVDDDAFLFVVKNLASDAPVIKWESARVIANTAHLFPKLLKKAVSPLLVNTEYPGTVVRWSAAMALSSIIQSNTSLNKELIPAVAAIEKREEDNAIKKIYQKALKKIAGK